MTAESNATVGAPTDAEAETIAVRIAPLGSASGDTRWEAACAIRAFVAERRAALSAPATTGEGEWSGLSWSGFRVSGDLASLEKVHSLIGMEARAQMLEDEIKQLRAALPPSSGHHHGWLYHNPDTGEEWSESHPLESGEVPDAGRVRPATAKALHELLIAAWSELEDARDEAVMPPSSGWEAAAEAMRANCAAWCDTNVPELDAGDSLRALPIPLPPPPSSGEK